MTHKVSRPANRWIFWTIILVSFVTVGMTYAMVAGYQVLTWQTRTTATAISLATAEALELDYQKIVVDGKEVLRGTFPRPPGLVNIEVDLVNAQTLRLEVDNGGNGHWCDHAAWGDARLVK